ncbi:hypothetical protein TNCV_2333381 [Trichonephila clavipes]|nr:hypothetical protein TNCV_2333381 [Trichonephila clavipes]
MTDILNPKPSGSAMELVDETSSDHKISESVNGRPRFRPNSIGSLRQYAGATEINCRHTSFTIWRDYQSTCHFDTEDTFQSVPLSQQTYILSFKQFITDVCEVSK